MKYLYFYFLLFSPTKQKIIKKIKKIEKIKKENLGQSPDNLKHFLFEDLHYDIEDPIKLIDEAVVANVIKSVIFNCKVACRIVRPDTVANDTVLGPETYEKDANNEQNVGTVICEKV